jgi:hypothetical protein
MWFKVTYKYKTDLKIYGLNFTDDWISPAALAYSIMDFSVSHPSFIVNSSQSGSTPAKAVKSYILIRLPDGDLADRYNLVFTVKNGTTKNVSYTYGNNF